MKKITSLLALAVTGFGLQSASARLLYDGDFALIGAAGGNNESFYTGNPVAGWQTSNPSGLLEIWESNNTVPGYWKPDYTASDYFAEMNADTQSSFWQVVTADDTSPYYISFAHQGRGGTDTAGLSIYSIGAATSWSQGEGTLLYQTVFSSPTGGWTYYYGEEIMTPVNGQNYAMVFDSISSANGNPSYGNLLAHVEFGDSTFAMPDATTLSSQSFTPWYASSSAVPEPGQVAASLLLLGGIGGYVFLKRRKVAKAAAPAVA